MDVRTSPDLLLHHHHHHHSQHHHHHHNPPLHAVNTLPRRHKPSSTFAPQLRIRQVHRKSRVLPHSQHLHSQEHDFAPPESEYSHDTVRIRSSRYGFDDFWALAEEEEERSLILNSQLDGCLPFPTDLVIAQDISAHQSPVHSSHDADDDRATVSSVAARLRSLTDPPAVFDTQDEMTTFAQRSDSPPELTSSKSSKTSSFRSSNFSGFDGAIPSDLAHFEDIGLDDDHAIPAQDYFASNLNKKSSVRNLAGASAASKNHSPALPPMRELVNGANKGPQPHGTPKLDTAASSMSTLALPGGVRRASSQTINSAAIRHRSRSRSRSRSPSPAHQMQGPVTPSSIAGTSPGLRSMPSFDQRRLSSGPMPSPLPQRPRKTAKEIEQEYNDSDEDLPDDASLWNVPMSPKMYRTASSAATSAAASTNVSASTSPERPSYTTTPRPPRPTRISSIDPIVVPKTAPVGASEFPPIFNAVPPSPGRLSRGNTTGTMPNTYAFGKTRAKSWNNALSELSEEAKALSEALDAHAEEHLQRGEAAVPEEAIDPIPGKPLRSKTSIVNLPPLRTNNVMIDPLPISKEKERVLSRTRPSWLPPKNPKEEKKHLKEYQRMMELSLEAEKRRAAKEATAKCARDDTAATLERLWNDHVIPHWDNSIREPRTREMWWRGIPENVRPTVWQRAITNELGLTPNTFDKALARAKTVEASAAVPSAHSTDVPKEVHWLHAIRRDLKMTFPTLNLFQPDQPLHRPLLNVLSAYAFYRSDVGYVYGSHLPAALLVLVLRDEAAAFTALANLLNRPIPLAFLTGEPAGTQRTYELVLRLLAQKRPKLHKHLFGAVAADGGAGGLGFAAHDVLEPLLRTLFLSGSCVPAVVALGDAGADANAPSSAPSSSPSSRRNSGAPPRSAGISLPLALRLWDIIVFDGDGAIIRTCMGILAAKEMALYGSREEVLAILGWGGDLGLDIEAEGEDGVERIVAVVRDVGKEEGKKRVKKGGK